MYVVSNPKNEVLIDLKKLSYLLKDTTFVSHLPHNMLDSVHGRSSAY